MSISKGLLKLRDSHSVEDLGGVIRNVANFYVLS